MGAKKERDEAKVEAHVARLTFVTSGDAKVGVEEELARVQDALAVVKEAKRKAENEVDRLEVERTSLIL